MKRKAAGCRVLVFIPVGTGVLVSCKRSPVPEEAQRSGQAGRATTERPSQQNPDRNAYFGEEYIHTSWSVDAWVMGNRITGPDPFVSSGWFLLFGALLASDAKLALWTTTLLAVLFGLYSGYLNGAGMGQFDTAAVALLGLAFSVFVLVALAASFVLRLQAQWGRIAIRVVGSWIAASGLLMLGWTMRGS